MAQAKRRIFLVDDHPLVREWLTNLISQQDDLMVCGEAGDAATALSDAGPALPDVVIVDLSLADVTGFELIRALAAKYPQMRLIVLSMHDEKLYAERAMRAGAQGYIMKRETAANIINAVRRVLDGKPYISEQMVGVLTEKFADVPSALDTGFLAQLSDRELEVFDLLGRGFETRRIAEVLNVSIKTVQTYCARIKEKLKLRNAAELFREAVCWQEQRSSR